QASPRSTSRLFRFPAAFRKAKSVTTRPSKRSSEVSMYAVIFRAEPDALDEDYYTAVKLLRDLAFSEFRCREFVAVTEGGREIAVSYWDSEEDIRAWHAAAEHRAAQRQGL